MARWAGELEFEFQGDDEAGSFVATGKITQFLRNHLAKGEVQQAARLYESAGPDTATVLIDEAKSASSNTQKNLADMFVLARDFANAARVYEMAKRFADAAKYHEQGRNFDAAARCYEKEGDVAKAAAAYEKAGKIDQALALYQQAGALDAQAECLARAQRFYEAAAIYQKQNNVRSEVEMLRLVPVTDPSRIAAVKRLAEMLARYGHMDQAARLLMETVQQVEAAKNNHDLHLLLIQILEAMGKHDYAARVRNYMAAQLPGGTVQQKQLTATAGQAPPVAVSVGAPAAVAVQAPPVVVMSPSAPPGPEAGPSVGFGSATASFAPPPPEAAQKSPISDPFDSLSDPFGGGGARQEQQVDAYAQLKAIPIFGELNITDMKDLHRICQDVVHQPNQVVIEQGVRGLGLFVILAGQVQVQRVDPSGATTPLATLGAGTYLGEMSLIDDAPTSARVVALTPLRSLFISRERFDHFTYSHETAALRIHRLFNKTLAERLRQANLRK
ncbi:MAG: cyclic nucleotide-binding domain-containing protein [Myxococcota bacterium]